MLSLKGTIGVSLGTGSRGGCEDVDGTCGQSRVEVSSSLQGVQERKLLKEAVTTQTCPAFLAPELASLGPS